MFYVRLSDVSSRIRVAPSVNPRAMPGAQPKWQVSFGNVRFTQRCCCVAVPNAYISRNSKTIAMKRLSLFALSLFAVSALSAQSLERQVIGSAGDYVTAGNISLSYTVGEAATTTLSNGNLILTQGFQQPDDVGVGIQDPVPFIGDITVYPNPTSDIINVQITTDQKDLTLEVTTILGQSLISQELDLSGGSYSGTVDMQPYAAGNYVLYLRNADGKVVTSYKVQKIN
jgi:hypothetical protein